jgi:heme oxygenase
VIATQTTPLQTSLRDTLRASTQASHAALDHALMPAGTPWTAWRYRQFLRGTLAVIDALEPAIARHLPDSALSGATRADRLRHDLRALDDRADVVPAAVAIDDQLASAFGAAYVVEGSMLGGQHVARALERDLGLEPRHLTYLRPSAGPPGSRWTAFVAALDAFGAGATATDWRIAERAAQAAFDAFARSFRREGLVQ